MTVIARFLLGRPKLPQRFSARIFFHEKHSLQLWRGVRQESSARRGCKYVYDRWGL